jgi:hypothetical protein
MSQPRAGPDPVELLNPLLVALRGSQPIAAALEKVDEVCTVAPRCIRGDVESISNELGKRRLSAARVDKPEQDAWELENPGSPDPEFYRAEVFPAVQAMSLKAIQKATGLSLPQCGRIRRGEQMPHRRWWEALGEVRQTGHLIPRGTLRD